MFRVGQKVEVKPLEELERLMGPGRWLGSIRMLLEMLDYAGKEWMVTGVGLNVQLNGVFWFPKEAIREKGKLYEGDWVKVKSWKQLEKIACGTDADGALIMLSGCRFLPSMRVACGKIMQVKEVHCSYCTGSFGMWLQGNPVVSRTGALDRTFTNEMVVRVKNN